MEPISNTAVSYGPWVGLGVLIVGGSLILVLKISQTSRVYPLLVFGAAVLSIALNYALWQTCNYVAQP